MTGPSTITGKAGLPRTPTYFIIAKKYIETPMRHAPIAVAVSGGADSLFALLTLAGGGSPVFALHGLFQPETPASREVRLGLAAACRTLEVPFHAVDLTADFRERVVHPFVAAYAEGRTPNPCALCNREIKFGLLLDAARSLGAGCLATGHYAKLSPPCGREEETEYPDHARNFLELGGPALLEAEDATKDQSYFLSLVPGGRLRHAFFPLSRAHKSEVRASLELLGVTPPQPLESQEVCFIAADYQSALPELAQSLGVGLPGPGPMLLEDGTEVGRHRGLWRHTEGSRRGLGVAWSHPLYVRAKEPKSNALLLGEKFSIAGCVIGELNILLDPQHWTGPILAKTRYRQTPSPTIVVPRGLDRLELRFLEPESPTASGQIACLYMPVPDAFHSDGRPVLRVIAAGIIESVLPV